MATGNYDANGIWNYGEDDNIALFSDTLNMLAESTSDAFTDDRSRLSTLEAGSLSGLIPIKPTAVVVSAGSASVNSLGVVTFTNTSSVSLENIFTAEYKNYRMFMDTSAVSTGMDLWFRFRKAGVTRTTGYFMSGFQTNIGGGSGVVNINSGSQIYLATLGASQPLRGRVVADITAPRTNIFARINFNSGYDSGSSILNLDAGGYNLADADFDAFSLVTSTGTFSGTVQVFGYND